MIFFVFWLFVKQYKYLSVYLLLRLLIIIYTSSLFVLFFIFFINSSEEMETVLAKSCLT